mmetsp:Transcript_13544/g.17746  ORF Transcript_13544/g.17746 Transcript_13544/m.17746 type:complete len:294 (+) Transcript_13544:147-1028(+)
MDSRDVQAKRNTRVATDRSIHAPPIDYGGRHPYEKYRKIENMHMRHSTEDYEDLTGNSSGVQEEYEGQEYKPIRISYDFKAVSGIDDPRIELLSQVLLDVEVFWAERLSVVPVEGDLVVFGSPDFLSDRCPSPPTTVSNADLLIHITVDVGCDTGGVLASAVSCERDQYGRPVIGAADFCLDSIDLNSVSSIFDVAIHEIGHVLGFSSDSLVYFRDPTTGEALTPRPLEPKNVRCVDGTKRWMYVPETNTMKEVVSDDGKNRHFLVTTPSVKTVVRNHFDCQTLEGEYPGYGP